MVFSRAIVCATKKGCVGYFEMIDLIKGVNTSSISAFRCNDAGRKRTKTKLHDPCAICSFTNKCFTTLTRVGQAA